MSETKGQTQQLTVDAGNSAIEIKVFDQAFRLRASGSGRLDTRLPTGFYTVRYSGGDARDEREITLRPGDPVRLTDPPNLPFSSAAPIDTTSTSAPAHQVAAHHLSIADTHQIGRGSNLFFFVRDVEPGPDQQPARALSLHKPDGAQVADLGQLARLGGTGPAFSAGRNISLDPGTYLLRLALDSDRSIDMAIHLVAGWQSQMFLLRCGGDLAINKRPLPDLPGAAQLMTTSALGFEPVRRVRRPSENLEPSEDLRLAELARHALAERRSDIASADMRAMLDGKWFDPLLGIFGLHLMLMAPSPDLDYAESVLGRLRSIVNGPHPDIEVLTLEIGSRRGRVGAVPQLDAPPMLRRSWDALVRLSADQTELIRPRSLLDRISTRLWGGGAWLVWETPQAPQRSEAPWWEPSRFRQAIELGTERAIDVVQSIDGGDLSPPAAPDPGAPPTRPLPPGLAAALDDLAQGLPMLVGLIRQLPTIPAESLASRIAAITALLRDVGYVVIKPALERLAGALGKELEGAIPGPWLEQFAMKAQLSEPERALFFYVIGQINSTRWRKTTATDPFALHTLVRMLDLPSSQITLVAAGLVTKIAAAFARGDSPKAEQSSPHPN